MNKEHISQMESGIYFEKAEKTPIFTHGIYSEKNFSKSLKKSE